MRTGEEKKEIERMKERRLRGKEREERDLRGAGEVQGGPSFRGTVRNG